MTITVEDMVRREVHYCVSYLVGTLAQGYGAIERDYSSELVDAFEQAFELASPIDDWEEAARERGWDKGVLTSSMPDEAIYRAKDPSHALSVDSWREACEHDDIEPHQREVYEHWIVSEWLADQLAAKGEKVDKDFAGMIVWARTTTGQGIAMDSVIQAIHAELVESV